MKKILFILIIGLALTGCDFHHRIVSSGATPEDVQKFLSEATSADSTNASQINALNEDPDTVLYYAEWGTTFAPMGPLNAVAPIDLDILTSSQDTIDQITDIRIFFFNKDLHNGTFQNLLLISYEINGGRKIAVYSNIGVGDVGLIDDGNFSTILSGSAGTIEVTSYDVIEDHLSNDGIQIQLWAGDGSDLSYGKISNLEAF